MKFTLSWLKEHIEIKDTIKKISNELTDLGLEVEGIENLSDKYENFYVCKILKSYKHPNADRLKVCEVSTGLKSYKVVCGASNANVGLKTVFAPNGTYIPGTNFKLEKKNIRGVTGEGMLCSEKELGFEEKVDGIIELGNDYKIGKKLKDIIKKDYLLDICLTPNRGDCASVRGIARDLSAKLNTKLIKRKINKKVGTYESKIIWNLEYLENKNDCLLIYGRHFKINNNRPSPYWLSQKLNSIGLKSISSLVDITNYVLYDIGRPLHVFDIKKLEGDLKVVCLNKEEDFIGLDNKKYKLEKGDLVIKDNIKTVSIAGIMGGLNSCVDENTNEVFLEVAYFSEKKISQTGRRLGIFSDARYRFERGIDTQGLIEGLEYSTKLVQEICGGTFSTCTSDGKKIANFKKIKYQFENFNKLVGYSISKEKQENFLQSLGFIINKVDKNTINVRPPSWRHDVSNNNDIIEEILRLDGYKNISEEKIIHQEISKNSIFSSNQKQQISLRENLARMGLFEVITFSFISEKKVIPEIKINDNLKLENPISSELGIMRNSLLPNLLDTASRNFSRGIEATEIFEVGYIYKGIEISDQTLNYAILLSGNISKKTWHYPLRLYDFYDMKSLLSSLFEIFSAKKIDYVRSRDEWFHPGVSADIFYEGNKIASFGELHPRLKKTFKIKQPTIICEGSLKGIQMISTSKTEKKPLFLSPFLPLRKDFAFVLNSEKEVQSLIDVIRDADRGIGQVNIFDVYNNEDKNISIGVEVEFLQDNKVLNSEEINFLMKKIIDRVEIKLGAKLRVR